MCAGTNCQCDGNCQCGKVVAPGIVSCADCGWNVTRAYDTLSNKFVYPSLRTESSFSNNVKPNNKINQMENPSEKFPSQGVVSTATGLPGGLYGISMGLSPHPLGGGNNESSFADIASQKMVGFGIGQIWALNEPLKSYVPGQESGFAGIASSLPGYENLSEEDKKWADVFIANTESGGEESGLFNIFKAVARGPFCGKVCKSLGYMRRDDKTAFKKCKNSCSTVDKNFQRAKQGKWNYPPSPDGVEIGPTPAQIAAESAKEAAAALALAKANTPVADPDLILGVDRGTVPAKNNMMMYIIIGVVALIVIIAIIMLMRRRQTAAKA